MNNQEVFNAYEGGYFGKSYHYYINVIDGTYEFRSICTDGGIIVENSVDNSNMHIKKHDKKYYDKFINKLSAITDKWESRYVDERIMDGTQWHIHYSFLNKEYSGSNAYPKKYKKAMKKIRRYFK